VKNLQGLELASLTQQIRGNCPAMDRNVNIRLPDNGGVSGAAYSPARLLERNSRGHSPFSRVPPSHLPAALWTSMERLLFPVAVF